jgi:hypothetical protein
MQREMPVQVLEGAPKGWRILYFPGRDQAWTIQEYHPWNNDRRLARHWITHGFCTSERQAWHRLKAIAG